MIELFLSQIWAIDPTFATRMHPVILSRIENGKGLDGLVNPITPESLEAKRYLGAVTFDPDKGLYIGQTSQKDQVAVIPVIGTLTKRGGLCSYGMKALGQMIMKANQDPDIKGILLDMETPGGTVDGTPELGNIIRNSQKKVVTFIDLMGASAGYWLASQSDEIILNSTNPTAIGSIGVLTVHQNLSAYIAKNIGSVEIIRAEQSTDKARINTVEELTADMRKEVIQELTEVADQFIQVVKDGRGSRLDTGKENIFTGKMYKAEQALQLGMADAIDTFQAALDRAAGSGQADDDTEEKFSNSNKTANMNFISKMMNVLGLATTSEAEVSEEQAQQQIEDQVTTLQADLQTAQADLQATQASLDTVTSERDQAQADLATVTGERDQAQKDLAAAQQKLEATAESTSTAHSKGDRNEDEEEDNGQKIIDALPHNQAADKFLNQVSQGKK